MVTQHPRLQPSGKPTENITHSQPGYRKQTEHAEKSDIGDNMRNDTKSPEQAKAATTQHTKLK